MLRKIIDNIKSGMIWDFSVTDGNKFYVWYLGFCVVASVFRLI